MKNKVTTYLLYGIGEIVLVVIGILIAIQLDDLSQKEKDKTQARKYIDALIKEFQGNIDMLQWEIAYTQDGIDTLQILKMRMAEPGATIDTLLHIARYQFDYNYTSEVTLSNITFQTLENTGEIKLLDQRLRDTLYVYQARLRTFTNIIQSNIDYYRQLDVEYHKIYPTSGPDQFLENQLLDEIWRNVNRNDFALRFNALVSNKIITQRFILEFQQYLLLNTEYYLEFIKKNYNK